MRKQVFSIAILTILALSLSAAAKAKVDFTGTWKLDTAKSSGLPAGMEQTMTVTQTGDTIKLETKVKGGPQGELTVADSYILDGKETDFTPPNGKGKRTSKWSAEGSIEVSEKADVQTPDGSTMTVEATRKWVLSPDAKTLTIEMKVKTPQGEQEIRRTFVKQ